jgi:hypothetical protein
MIVCATFGNWIHGDTSQDNIVFALDKDDGEYDLGASCRGRLFFFTMSYRKEYNLGVLGS